MKSNTFPVVVSNDSTSALKKPELLERHRGAIQKVLREAKSFAVERKQSLEHIKDSKLRESAKK
jgi:hypothetical protein